METKSGKRGLGRGLSALMADLQPEDRADVPGLAASTVRNVPIEHVKPNPDQPRRDFSKSALDELAASIRQKGILQPLIVRPGVVSGEYEIVAGERRWRAAQMAQLHEVPVIERNFQDAELLEIAIIENVQRADLNPIEEASGYRQLIDRFGHTQEQVAEALSKSRSHIANLLRLLQLPEEVQSMLREGKLTAGHARALIGHPEAVALSLQVVGKGLTVRATEELARRIKTGARQGRSGRQPAEKDADTRLIEADLAANLRMGVSIDHEPGGSRGRLTITYSSLDDLDLLCRALSMLDRDTI